jgi:hypothetical protein
VLTEIREKSIIMKLPLSPKWRAFLGGLLALIGIVFCFLDFPSIIFILIGGGGIFTGLYFLHSGFKDIQAGKTFAEYIIDLEEGTFTNCDGKSYELTNIAGAEMAGNNAVANLVMNLKDSEFCEEIPGFQPAQNYDCQFMWVALNTVVGNTLNDDIHKDVKVFKEKIEKLLESL